MESKLAISERPTCLISWETEEKYLLIGSSITDCPFVPQPIWVLYWPENQFQLFGTGYTKLARTLAEPMPLLRNFQLVALMGAISFPGYNAADNLKIPVVDGSANTPEIDPAAFSFGTQWNFPTAPTL